MASTPDPNPMPGAAPGLAPIQAVTAISTQPCRSPEEGASAHDAGAAGPNQSPLQSPRRSPTTAPFSMVPPQVICAICTKGVYAAELLAFDGQSYHKACFRCSKCKKTLAIHMAVSFNGSIFCGVHNPGNAKASNPLFKKPRPLSLLTKSGSNLSFIERMAMFENSGSDSSSRADPSGAGHAAIEIPLPSPLPNSLPAPPPRGPSSTAAGLIYRYKPYGPSPFAVATATSISTQNLRRLTPDDLPVHSRAGSTGATSSDGERVLLKARSRSMPQILPDQVGGGGAGVKPGSVNGNQPSQNEAVTTRSSAAGSTMNMQQFLNSMAAHTESHYTSTASMANSSVDDLLDVNGTRSLNASSNETPGTSTFTSTGEIGDMTSFTLDALSLNEADNTSTTNHQPRGRPAVDHRPGLATISSKSSADDARQHDVEFHTSADIDSSAQAGTRNLTVQLQAAPSVPAETTSARSSPVTKAPPNYSLRPSKTTVRPRKISEGPMSTTPPPTPERPADQPALRPPTPSSTARPVSMFVSSDLYDLTGTDAYPVLMVGSQSPMGSQASVAAFPTEPASETTTGPEGADTAEGEGGFLTRRGTVVSTATMQPGLYRRRATRQRSPGRSPSPSRHADLVRPIGKFLVEPLPGMVTCNTMPVLPEPNALTNDEIPNQFLQASATGAGSGESLRSTLGRRLGFGKSTGGGGPAGPARGENPYLVDPALLRATLESTVHLPEHPVIGLEHVNLDAMYFRQHFSGQDHTNYVGFVDPPVAAISGPGGGQDPIAGPIVVSVRRDTQAHMYRLIIRTRVRDYRLEAHESEIKGRMRGSISRRNVITYVAPALGPAKLVKVRTRKIERELVKLDELRLCFNLKIGVVYMRKGQTSEDEVFANQMHSPAFDKLLKVLGNRVELAGFEGFDGGLDTKHGNMGTHSVHTRSGSFEIMYHVSTLLPFNDRDVQQIGRKAHIGNDIVSIVFVDQRNPVMPVATGSPPVQRIPSENSAAGASSSSGDSQSPTSETPFASLSRPSISGDTVLFDPTMIKSHYLTAYIVITEHQTLAGATGWRVAVTYQNDVPTFGPQLQPDGIYMSDEQLRQFLLAKMINAESAAFKSQKFQKLLGRTRGMLLDDLVKYYIKSNGADTTSGSGGGHSGAASEAEDDGPGTAATKEAAPAKREFEFFGRKLGHGSSSHGQQQAPSASPQPGPASKSRSLSVSAAGNAPPSFSSTESAAGEAKVPTYTVTADPEEADSTVGARLTAPVSKRAPAIRRSSSYTAAYHASNDGAGAGSGAGSGSGSSSGGEGGSGGSGSGTGAIMTNLTSQPSSRRGSKSRTGGFFAPFRKRSSGMVVEDSAALAGSASAAGVPAVAAAGRPEDAAS